MEMKTLNDDTHAHGGTRYSRSATDTPKSVETNGQPLNKSKVIKYQPPEKGLSTLWTAQKKEQFMNKNIRQKFIISAALMIAATASAFAQGNGIAGITEATSMVTSYFDPGTKLIYAIGAVVGLIGGVKVYGKFSSGDPDTSKTSASWFCACIFLIVAATILRSFFL